MKINNPLTYSNDKEYDLNCLNNNIILHKNIKSIFIITKILIKY